MTRPKTESDNAAIARELMDPVERKPPATKQLTDQAEGRIRQVVRRGLQFRWMVHGGDARDRPLSFEGRHAAPMEASGTEIRLLENEAAAFDARDEIVVSEAKGVAAVLACRAA